MIYCPGGGFHLCIGVSFAIQVITDIVKVVYSLKNVKRAPGDAGRLVGTTKMFNEVEVGSRGLMKVILLTTEITRRINTSSLMDRSLTGLCL